jgi:gliding motility-associated-like protein
MKKVIIAFLTFTCILLLKSNAQETSHCPNSDFSFGNFTNWQGFYGDFANPSQYDGFDPDGHMIMKDPVPMDPNTCEGLNPIPPGEKFSARLGDDKHDSHADQLRYLIDVTPERNLFIYKYAVVLEDPGHDPGKQPNFTIEVADSSGQLFDSACGYYFVYAHEGIPTWHTCGEVIWKDWTTVGIDLTDYIGQTVSIKFTSRDCAVGGHFGYAYLSAYCSHTEITFGSCPGDTIATVTAPPGFSYLWANGDITPTTIIHNPVIGMVDSCILTSVNGCKVTVKGIFKPTIVKADFGCTQHDCVGSSFVFSDSSTINQNIISKWLWDFDDGSPLVADSQDLHHVYDSAGEYSATLIVTSSDGCPDTVAKQITVTPIPEINFTADPSCGNQTSNDTIFFDKQTLLEVGQGYDSYIWSNGDTAYSIPVDTEGLYKVTIVTGGICSSTDSVMMLHCSYALMMPNAFTPNGDGLNDLFRPATYPENITAFHMIISDRWGQFFFETYDIPGGWDGTIEGEPASSGVYAYYITFKDHLGAAQKMTGTVTLVR